MSDGPNGHLGEERIQDFLDGALPEPEREGVEDHLARCARCRSAVESWSALFAGLEELPELAPSPAFAERVMEALPEPRSLLDRIRDRLGRLREAASRAHPLPEIVLDYVDGALPERRRRRVAGHVDGCATCRQEVAVWRELFDALETLPRHAPSPGFAEAVLARVRTPERSPATESAPALDRALGWLGGLTWPRALRPRTAGQWALAGGAVLAPFSALVGGALALFSHPQLTPGYLTAFLWWQVSDGAVALAGAAWNALTESALVFRAYSLVQETSVSAEVLGVTALAVSAAMACSLWVLYRNLFTTSSVDSRYAKLSA